jgi:hypothetical protein
MSKFPHLIAVAAGHERHVKLAIFLMRCITLMTNRRVKSSALLGGPTYKLTDHEAACHCSKTFCLAMKQRPL